MMKNVLPALFAAVFVASCATSAQAATSLCPAGTQFVHIYTKASLTSFAPVEAMMDDTGDYSDNADSTWKLTDGKNVQFAAKCLDGSNVPVLLGTPDIPLGVNGCTFAAGTLTCQ